MTPVMIIEHLTHPGHTLSYISSNTQFLCDGCKKPGHGNRYRCGTCDFDLHEYCGTYPTLLPSFMHPMHQLALTPLQDGHMCDVCGASVDGFFYRCNACDFDAHPLCMQPPQFTRHPLHAHHVLRLQPLPGPSSSGWCMGCRTTSGNAWGYTCVACDFDIHLRCFNSPHVGPVYLGSGLGSGSGLGLGSGSGSRSSTVSGLARGFVRAYQNSSSGQSDGSGNDVYSTIIQWATSNWLN